MVSRIIPPEVVALAETTLPSPSFWVLSRTLLHGGIDTLKAFGFDRVWFACKACPLAELASEATASGAGLLITSAHEAKRLDALLARSGPWGFALSSEERRRDMRWLLRRSSPDWLSVGDEKSLALFAQQRAQQPADRAPALLMRLRPPRGISTDCGFYGFAPEDLPSIVRNHPFVGLHFHIGSNRTGDRPYLRLLEYARELWDRSQKAEVHPRFVNLGGGFSAGFSHWEALAARARVLFPHSQIWVEPGRFLVQRSLFWIVQAAVRDNEIHTGDAFPVSAKARRSPPRLKGFLRASSGEWLLIAAEAVGERRLRIVSPSRIVPPALRGREIAVFYDCAAYHWLPAAPFVTS